MRKRDKGHISVESSYHQTQLSGELPVFGVFDKGKIKETEESLLNAAQLGKELAKPIL